MINVQTLDLPPQKLIPVTVYCGAIGSSLPIDFVDFADSPWVFKRAVIGYPVQSARLPATSAGRDQGDGEGEGSLPTSPTARGFSSVRRLTILPIRTRLPAAGAGQRSGPLRRRRRLPTSPTALEFSDMRRLTIPPIRAVSCDGCRPRSRQWRRRRSLLTSPTAREFSNMQRLTTLPIREVFCGGFRLINSNCEVCLKVHLNTPCGDAVPNFNMSGAPEGTETGTFS